MGGCRRQTGASPAWRRHVEFAAAGGRVGALREIKPLVGVEPLTVSLPPDVSLLRLLRLPPAGESDILPMVELQLARQMPFPGEEVAMGCEVVLRQPEGLWVLAGATPMSFLVSLDEDMRAAGLRISRIDLNLLGLWRSWREKAENTEPGRTVLLAADGDGVNLLVLEQAVPVLGRRLIEGGDGSGLGLELTRSLMNLEMEQGAEAVSDVCWIGDEPPDAEAKKRLTSLLGRPPRELAAGALEPPVMGVVRRSMANGGEMNIFPRQWVALGSARRTRRRTMALAATGLAVWLISVIVLWGGPWLAARSLAETRRSLEGLAPEYNEVRELRQRVRLIMRYTDRSRSLLEGFRLAGMLLPEGIELTSLNYRREDGLRLSGEARTPEQVYTFKERMDNVQVFAHSSLVGPTWDQRRSRHVFELNAHWGESEE